MLSILVLVRNTTKSAAVCVQSLIRSVAALGMPKEGVEYVLIDDCSDAGANVVALFKEVRAVAAPSDVRIIRFKSHQHYAYGLALGLSVTRGTAVLFVSHDMIVTPACVKTLLETAASDATIGIVRPVSPHMDCSREQQVRPPDALPLRSDDDVNAFSRFVARHHGLALQEPSLLIGDAMLVTRAAIDRIGVFDTRFFGFMADIDYGVRARRAGLRVVTALGAWLYHEGSGTRRATQAAAGAEAEQALVRQIDADVATAWEVFRRKWDPTLPGSFQEIGKAHVARLVESPPATTFDNYQPPIAVDPNVCEVL